MILTLHPNSWLSTSGGGMLRAMGVEKMLTELRTETFLVRNRDYSWTYCISSSPTAVQAVMSINLHNGIFYKE